MKFTKQTWTRRTFLSTFTGVGAGVLFSPLSSWAKIDIDPKVAAIVAKTMSIDTHNHIDIPLSAGQSPSPTFDLLGDFKKSGLSAICLTFAVDYQKLENEGDAYNRFINGLDGIDALLKKNNLTRSMNLKDLTTSFKKRQPAIIQSVEGGHFLEGQIDRLKIAYDRGLRVLGLLHDNDASVPLGDIYTKPPQWNGLTKFGAEVVQECNKMGILIDLTHCNNKTIDDALKISTKPMIITHTSLDTQLGNNEKMAQMMKPRLISKEQAKIVADAGGVIGAWRHLTDTPLEYVQNIRALVDVVGVDNVCIGTDTKISRALENKNPFRLGENTNQIWQNQEAGFFYAVVDSMLKTGFSEKEIIKIASANFCRVFEAATKNTK